MPKMKMLVHAPPDVVASGAYVNAFSILLPHVSPQQKLLKSIKEAGGWKLGKRYKPGKITSFLTGTTTEAISMNRSFLLCLILEPTIKSFYKILFI
ncbi:hypothetical protein LXL04_026430 [Taraxacum kok-saghyz]